MRPEYDFSEGVPWKYHQRYMESSNVVVFEPDVHRRFRNSSAVNKSASFAHARRRNAARSNEAAWADAPRSAHLKIR